MKKLLPLSFVFTLILSCKVYQPVDRIKPNLPKDERSIIFQLDQLERINLGDSLRLKTLDQKYHYLIFHSVQNDSLKGIFWKSTALKIDHQIDSGVLLSEIQELYVRKKNTGLTIAAMVGAVGLSLVLISLIAINTGGLDLY